jgi:hypothetical protein
MRRSISALQHAQSFGLRLSASQPGLANRKAEMLTSCLAKPSNVLTS